MSIFDWDLKESYRFIKNRRQIIGPKDKLRKLLMKYELHIKKKQSFDILEWEQEGDLVHF